VPPAAFPSVAGFAVELNGAPAPEALLAGLGEIRVEDNLMLPDSCTVRISTHEAGMDLGPLGIEIGKGLKVKLQGAHREGSPLEVFDGEMVSVEPDFGPHGAVLHVRAYDRSHRLNRQRKTRVFQDVTYDDVAKKIAGEAGLSAKVESAPGGTHPYVQQSTETDWQFLWRLSQRIGFEVYVIGRELNFRPLSTERDAVDLKLGETLSAFRPRITASQQVKSVEVRGWDAVQQQAIVGTSGSAEPLSTAGNGRGKIASAFAEGDDKVVIGNAPVSSVAEAKALADSVLAKLADSYVEAEGDAMGDPRLRAGSKIKIDGCGPQFNGEYALTSTVHQFTAERGYHTRFRISGRTQRTLLDLMTPGKHAPWANGLVIGIVTNNQDPDKLARVRVKFPTLDDSVEGWWARVASINAGDERGVLMMPQVDDEVVVGFEHGDPQRPFVVGSLWNGQAKPTDMDDPAGNFELRSLEKVTIKGKKDILVESDAKITTKSGAEILIDGQTVTIKGAGEVKVEASGSLTLKGNGVTVDGGGGVVQVSGSQIMLG
jgi:phage protein D